jgi:hypothetical protein
MALLDAIAGAAIVLGRVWHTTSYRDWSVVRAPDNARYHPSLHPPAAAEDVVLKQQRATDLAP